MTPIEGKQALALHPAAFRAIFAQIDARRGEGIDLLILGMLTDRIDGALHLRALVCDRDLHEKWVARGMPEMEGPDAELLDEKIEGVN